MALFGRFKLGGWKKKNSTMISTTATAGAERRDGSKWRLVNGLGR
jgi:hypothetical protein